MNMGCAPATLYLTEDRTLFNPAVLPALPYDNNSAMSQRNRVFSLYRQLYHLGKEYPKGKEWFHSRLKNTFLKNKDETDPKKVEELIKRAEFVVKEVEALYSLRKYRAMKSRYYDAES